MKSLNQLKDPTHAEREALREEGVVFRAGRVTACGLGYYPADRRRGGYLWDDAVYPGGPVVQVTGGDPASHAEVAFRK